MRKITLIFSAALLVGFTSCKNEANEQAQKSAKEFNDYVDSVKNVTPVYTDSSWTVIDNGYQERAIKAEASLAALKEEDKKKTEESKAKYAELKANYDVEIQKAKNDRIALQKQKLRNALFGQDKIGADMSFDWVTGKNIRSVFEAFVNAVDLNKDSYSREDWDEIKVLYEALDNKKNTVEKDLSAKDNMAIAKEKVKFTKIHAANRVTSKVDENSASKE
jgi:hypothetical protein